MPPLFPIIEVPAEAAEAPEQVGTKYKFWFSGSAFMYKEGRPNTGENWSEKAACEIAEKLGLPHANYDLASWRNRNGVVTPNFVVQGARLVLGNEVLSTSVRGYEKDRIRNQRAHTVRAAMSVLRNDAVRPP